MATSHHHAHEPASLGHEPTDVDLSGAPKILIYSVLFMVITFAAMWLMFRFFINLEQAKDPPRSPVVSSSTPRSSQMGSLPGERTPAGPQLQTDEPLDLRTFRRAEDALLHNYGWIDKEKGIVRLPVERAIDLLAERGLPAPARAGAAPAPAPTAPSKPAQ